MWNLVLLPRATLFLLLLLRISVGIEAMVSGICVCHSLTVVPTKSSLIFSRKGALRGNTINGLLKCLDTLRSLDRWFCISSQTECAWICTRKSSSLKKGSVVCFFFFFSLSLGWIRFWNSLESERIEVSSDFTSYQPSKSRAFVSYTNSTYVYT